MNLTHSVDALLFFISQWCGTTAPRVVAAFAGVLILVLVITALVEAHK